MGKNTFGVIVSNRDFFPDHLVAEARQDILGVLADMQIDAVLLGENDTKLGGVETHAEARRCAELFQQNRQRIEGVLVVLPNFGDEKGVADTLKLAQLDVPVLVQGYPDELNKLDVARRRDAFCGKISVCNNLQQAGIPYSLTRRHVVDPRSEEFRGDLRDFAAVCRVVNGLRTARIGAIGARPGAFNTVRYSEKILEANGISVTTVDLSEILGEAERMDCRRRKRASATGGDRRLRQIRRRPPGQARADGQAGRRDRQLDGGQCAWTLRPSSAGPPCSRTSVSTSAR